MYPTQSIQKISLTKLNYVIIKNIDFDDDEIEKTLNFC